MTHFYESTLIDTIDGLQCKSYGNEHPKDFIIVKPKYIPANILKGQGLQYRFLFKKAMIRFNLFGNPKTVLNYFNQFKKKLPNYIYKSPLHNNWFFVVPKNRIKEVHNGRQGVVELLKIPMHDYDDYLLLVRQLIDLIMKSGVSSKNLGLTHSTLLGNYTYGKSDIDIIIYGKANGWKVLNFLKTAKHEKLRWRTEREWLKYYETHRTAETSHFTPRQYAKQMARKRYEGLFGGTIFTLYTVEEPDETWFKWGEEKYKPLGLATVQGEVTDNSNSHVKPGFYEMKNGRIINMKNMKKLIDPKIPIKRVVSYSLNFLHQVLIGETIQACGMLELVINKRKGKYYRLVVGYFDAYFNERREKEYIKAEI